MPIHKHLAAAALAISTIIECSAAMAADRLVLTPCQLEGQPARCGVLEVAENPDQPQGRQLAIHVAVLPATPGPALSDPIVPLLGGPGEAAISEAAYHAGRAGSLRKDHDLLLVDQRGTGLSNALHCDLYSPSDPAISLREVFQLAATAQCEQELSRRTDLTQYSYARFANDLEQIRVALGYGPLNLSGGSYGTRAAQIFMRAFPKSVRTAFLQSVVPVDVPSPEPMAATGQTALENTLAACTRDSSCKVAFPNIRAELPAIMARLDSGHVSVTVAGMPSPATLDRGRVAEWFRSSLYRPQNAAQLPWLIHQAYLGNWKPIADGILEDARDADSGLSFGLFFSITCSDDVPFVGTLAADIQHTVLRDYRVRQQTAACKVWPKAALPEGYRTPVTSSIPTLFATGDLDGGTPLWYTEHASKGFSNSFTVVQHGQGHTEWNDCLAGIYEQFVRSASVHGLDAIQCKPIPRPPFKTR